MSQSYPQSGQPVEKTLSTGVGNVKMLSITSVDTKKAEKDIHMRDFRGKLFEFVFFRKIKESKNKVSKVEKVWYPIMVARNKSTSEVDNE